MTTHPGRYPPLTKAEHHQAIAAIEVTLSQAPFAMVEAADVADLIDQLQAGDIVAVATHKPGLWISHVGLVAGVKGEKRLLHASSHHGRVVLTRVDLSQYMRAQTHSRGIIVLRPVAPPREPGTGG